MKGDSGTNKMRMHKATIIVKRTNPKNNPNSYNNLPYTSKIGRGREWLYKEEEVLTNIAEYLLRNPYNFIVLKNKIPEEEKERALTKTLGDLVKIHNTAVEKQGLILKLGDGIKYFRLRRAKKILKKVAKENGKR